MNIIRRLFTDRVFRVPRAWSNSELRECARLFTGSVVNVSAWRDEDKEGRHYKEYFCRADSYSTTNFKPEYQGLQGNENEIFLDLEERLPANLANRFDVVFNHTTLEHIYKIEMAFRNLCCMSRDIVILVVPFIQQMHSDYGDYWRFTPLSIKRMFEDKGMTVLYLSCNEHKRSSVYLFCMASKHPDKWRETATVFSDAAKKRHGPRASKDYVGRKAIINNPLVVAKELFKGGMRKFSILRRKQ